MGKDEFGTVRLGMGDELLTISANAPEVGNAFDELLTTRVEGEKSDVALRARYLLDVLRAVTDDQILLQATGPISPLVVRPLSEDVSSYLYLIMPVTLNA